MNSGAARSQRSPWAVLGVTSLAIFAVWLDSTVLFVAFPAIRTSFADVSVTELSWVLNAYTVVLGATVVPAGRLADRVGRRATFLAGVVLFTVASIGCGLAQSPGVLVAARVAQAVGAALSLPASLALVLAAFPAAKRPIALSLWGAVAALSAAAGPALGSLVIDRLNWHWVFLLNVPIGVATLVLVPRVVAESKDRNAGRLPDALGIALAIVGVGAITLGIVQGNSWGWSSARTLGALGAGAVTLLLFVAQCARSPSPVLDLALFRDRSFRYANAATLAYLIAFTAMFLGMILFQTQVWNYSVLEAGLGATPGPLTVIPVAILAGRLASRRGHRELLVMGSLVYAAGAAVLAFGVPQTPAYVTRFLPAAITTGIGVGLVLPSLTAAAVHGLTDRFAVGSAVNQAVRQVGAALGVACTLAILTATPGVAGFEWVFTLVLSGGVVTAILSLRIDTRPKLPI